MNRNYYNKNNKSTELKNQIIKRQIDEIESLKKIVFDLQIDCDKKNKLIYSINNIRNDLLETIADLKTKREEYDRLIAELINMRNAVNQVVFKGKWKLIRLLLK